MMQLTNGQHACVDVFVPEADILNMLCDYKFVFSVLDKLMFHTMLDAIGLRVYYKSIKCDVSFSQGSISTIFRLGGHFFLKISSCLQQSKNYNKNRSRFSKLPKLRS